MKMKCFLPDANARRRGLLPFMVDICEMGIKRFSVPEPVTPQFLNPVPIPISIPVPRIMTGISIVAAVSIVVMASTEAATSSAITREDVRSTVLHINVLYPSA